jgi:hypothetical protein
MILFYSSQCNHCNTLLQTLNIHDKDKKIKLLSIDYLKSNNYVIDNRITHVPALYLVNDDKYIFGRVILDFLFKPNSGILLNNNDNDNDNNNNNNSIQNNNDQNTILNNNNLNEPNGLFSDISQNFETIDNSNDVMGPVSLWEDISNDNNNNNNNNNNFNLDNNDNDNDKPHKKLPSIAEIQEMRNKDI